MSLVLDKKIIELIYMTWFIDEDPLEQIKFVHLFKVAG